jgi:hypothetical protein
VRDRSRACRRNQQLLATRTRHSRVVRRVATSLHRQRGCRAEPPGIPSREDAVSRLPSPVTPLPSSPGVLHPVLPIFRAVATAVVPEAESLRASEWAEVEAVVEGALAARPLELRRQIVAFLRALEYLALVRCGRRLTKLDRRRRERFLLGVQRSRIYKLRRGMWGVRTLVFLAYYTRPEVITSLGYRAAAAGWGARRSPDEVRFPTPAHPVPPHA